MQTAEIATFFVKEKKRVCRYLESFASRKWDKQAQEYKLGGVKFEYVRIRLFRSLKRSLRQYLNKGSFGLGGVASRSNHQSELIIEKIKYICAQHRQLISAFADTKQGPRIDSVHSKDDLTAFKTYNNKYMAAIFSNTVIRNLYLLYIELIFTETDIGKLCRNWKMHCCAGEHGVDCEGRWKGFREVLEQEAEIHVNAGKVFRVVEREEVMVVCQ